MSPTKRETILEIVAEAQREADSWDAHTMPEVYVRRIRAAMADDDEVVGYLRRDVDGSQFYERLDRAQLDQECIGGDVYRVVGPPIPLEDD